MATTMNGCGIVCVVLSMETRPSSGEASRRMSEKSVVLPAPFGPTRPMRSPRLTCNEAS